MLSWKTFSAFPAWNTEGAGGGAGDPAPTQPASPPAADPTSPAPSEPPAPPAPAEPFDETTSFALEAFDAMLRDDVEEPEAPSPEPIPQEAATPPPVVAQTPVAPAAPGPTPPQAPVAAPQTAPQTATATPSQQAVVAPPQAAAPQQMSFDQLAEELAKQQDALITALAEKQYGNVITEQDLEDFQLNPTKVLAKIAATVQVNTTASNMKVFAQQMPVMVQRLLQANRQNQEAENRFWEANPHLDRSKHRAVVADVMQKMRAINPDMDTQTFIKEVGVYAGMKAGVGPQASGANAPQVRTPGPVVRNTNGAGAFAPVGAGAAPPSAHPAPPQNEWERLFEIMSADERGAFET